MNSWKDLVFEILLGVVVSVAGSTLTFIGPVGMAMMICVGSLLILEKVYLSGIMIVIITLITHPFLLGWL